MENYSVDEPIYALATAYAPSALAVVRTSGKGSIGMIAGAFSPSGRLVRAANGTLVHGHVLDEDGTTIDEVVLSVYREGHGYTGEEAVEISTHGSLMVLRRLSARLVQLGFRPALRGEFTFRAFMHGRMDLTQAEAVEEIIGSRSVKSQEKAMDRLAGQLREAMGSIRTRLLDILASLEVQLDYAEDEILEDWVFPEEEVDDIIASLRSLVSTYDAGRIHRDGAKVVLAGKANAGKSSLFNLLVKEDRAIVSPVPGTTRDFIETWIDLGGIPVRLYDTAGLRSSDDEVESEGIRRSASLMAQADLVVYLVDPEDDVPLDELDETKTILVYSKSDRRRVEGALSISSLTGEGVGDLVAAIVARLSSGTEALQDDTPVIDSRRQRDSLIACIEALENARASRGQSVDIMALFFQRALEEIGLITGEVTNEELLDTLFSQFCLGK